MFSPPGYSEPTSPVRSRDNNASLSSPVRNPSRFQPRDAMAATARSGTASALNATQGGKSTINDADNIKVAVRVRPLMPGKLDNTDVSVLQVSEDHSTIQVVVPGPAGNKMQRDFQFHACLGPDASQADVLHLCGVPQLLDAALAGYNVTIFAYGQTGSGKTYTMSGREEVIGSDGYQGDTHDGIVTRAVHYLYQKINERTDSQFKLSASYLEIYNEAVFDLLTAPVMSGRSNSNNTSGGSAGGGKDLSIKWDPAQGFFVPGLKTVHCANITKMMEVIRTGMKHRHVGSHELNMESSRSHSLMTIYVAALPTDSSAWDYGTQRCGKICFVDLAGSERLKDSKSEGTMLKETANINKSLFVLGKVISALAERDAAGVSSAHIPYRDSKLTKLLMDSIGGSAMALMIACCSPSIGAVEETLSTLTYATRAKNIQNRPTVQYDPREAQLTALRREIELLRQENQYLREQLRLGNGSLPATPSSLTTLLAPSNGSWGEELQNRHKSLQEAPSSRPDWATFSSTPSSSLKSRSALQGASQTEQSEPGSMQSEDSGVLQRSQLARTNSSDRQPISVGQLGQLRPGSGSSWKNGQPPLSQGPETSDDLAVRLKSTQALLTKFSEENGRLARENERLRTHKAVMGSEHAGVLEEIECLRNQLSGLETAVLQGNASPSATKAMLSTWRQGSMSSNSGYIEALSTPGLSIPTSLPPSRDAHITLSGTDRLGSAQQPSSPLGHPQQLGNMHGSSMSQEALVSNAASGSAPVYLQTPPTSSMDRSGGVLYPQPPLNQRPGSQASFTIPALPQQPQYVSQASPEQGMSQFSREGTPLQGSHTFNPGYPYQQQQQPLQQQQQTHPQGYQQAMADLAVLNGNVAPGAVRSKHEGVGASRGTTPGIGSPANAKSEADSGGVIVMDQSKLGLLFG